TLEAPLLGVREVRRGARQGDAGGAGRRRLRRAEERRRVHRDDRPRRPRRGQPPDPMKSYHDIQGDGGSNILEQVVEQKERIAQALSRVKHRVAVGSGKGGVGKSTVTRTLAAALAARGLKVAIVDADFNGPTQARMTGLRGAVPVPGVDGIALPKSQDGVGVFSVGAFLPESEALDFASVSKGESHTWRATKEFAALGEVLAAVNWGPLD